ncbi:hypothetical protein DPEC_G00028690 [Dallia pectoralis]|uniref:Uncharacterized protein n=1 Tax=Dallia pectoralis TaxID=75939 RepID=A0ACC2HI54_DALPE|nr:hypothetical protein DPEC_G00028690 [Dallia pectoralis]
MPRESCGGIWCRGLYSCYWKSHSDRKPKRSCCWFSVVTVAALLSLCWMYVCLTSFNDREDVNWMAFTILQHWVNWFLVVVILSAMLTVYFVLLLVFALFQLVLKESLDLHCVHKVFLFAGVVFMVLGTIGISIKWTIEWRTVLLSLQATAPFLQMGGVGALILVSWPVFKWFCNTDRTGSKVFLMAVFLSISVAIFLSPLLIQSPCLFEPGRNLTTKPKLIGHRGAPMLAPENTMMSFQRSMECGVMAFETDVQLSKDGVPFLMHDHTGHFLTRTTDVKQKFPGIDFNHSKNITWAQLQTLNAGDWFLKTNPFGSVSQLSEQEKDTAMNQSIPSLQELLGLSNAHNISVIFDLKSDLENNDTLTVVKKILDSNISQELIHWLPSEHREDVRKMAPQFRQVYDNVSEMILAGGDHLNVKYSELSTADIRSFRNKSVSVNLWVVNERWLFSLVWCSGASSVTTNACPLLMNMSQPDWTMNTRTYLSIWIAVDLGALLIMFLLFIYQWKSKKISFRLESERNLLPHSHSLWS